MTNQSCVSLLCLKRMITWKESLEFQITYKTLFLILSVNLRIFLWVFSCVTPAKEPPTAWRLQAILPEKGRAHSRPSSTGSTVPASQANRTAVLAPQGWQSWALPQRVRGHILRHLLNSYDEKSQDWQEKGFSDPENVILRKHTRMYRFIYIYAYKAILIYKCIGIFPLNN